MTDNNHPITPPTSLVQLWIARPACQDYFSTVEEVAIEAARWGADQELMACINYFHEHDPSWGENSEPITGLRAARRPKSPSLKEQALAALARLKSGALCADRVTDESIIRRALESLPD